MVKEGTPGKYKLQAVEPGSRRPLIERAGYTVIIRLAETVREVLAPRAQRPSKQIYRPSDCRARLPRRRRPVSGPLRRGVCANVGG